MGCHGTISHVRKWQSLYIGNHRIACHGHGHNPTKHTTTSTMQSLQHHIIFPHGCPKQLLTVQGPQFKGEVLQILTKGLGIQQDFTSPYHPQTNGVTEHMNQTIKQVISRPPAQKLGSDPSLRNTLIQYLSPSILQHEPVLRTIRPWPLFST